MENLIEKQKLISIQNILKTVFVIVPLVAGFDKFTNLLVQWEMYINPILLKLLPVSGHTFMYAVGIIEMIAGIVVFVQPRIGAYIVSLWLVGIALNLLLSGHYLDVAVRDLVMATGAYTLARVSALIGDEQRSKNSVLASAYQR